MVKVLYTSTIVSLMYAMFCSKLDIVKEVGVVSRYMNNSGKVYLKMASEWAGQGPSNQGPLRPMVGLAVPCPIFF